VPGGVDQFAQSRMNTLHSAQRNSLSITTVQHAAGPQWNSSTIAPAAWIAELTTIPKFIAWFQDSAVLYYIAVVWVLVFIGT
jgi:hypothetical protein